MEIIVYIIKEGQKNDDVSYRGVSLLSAIPKLFEAIVADELI